jgi:hypothetical protein
MKTLNRRFETLNNKMCGWLKETLTDPCLYITFIVSGLISLLGNYRALYSVRVDIGNSLLQINGVLLGIILAGLAVFVVLLDKKYIKLIERVYNIESELWPFKWTAIISIVCIIFGMGLIIIGNPYHILFRLILWGGLWSFAYLLWQIYELIKFLAGHAKTRAKQIQMEEESIKRKETRT